MQNEGTGELILGLICFLVLISIPLPPLVPIAVGLAAGWLVGDGLIKRSKHTHK